MVPPSTPQVAWGTAPSAPQVAWGTAPLAPPKWLGEWCCRGDFRFSRVAWGMVSVNGVSGNGFWKWSLGIGFWERSLEWSCCAVPVCLLRHCGLMLGGVSPKGGCPRIPGQTQKNSEPPSGGCIWFTVLVLLFFLGGLFLAGFLELGLWE